MNGMSVAAFFHDSLCFQVLWTACFRVLNMFCIIFSKRSRKQLTGVKMPVILARRLSGEGCGWTLKIEQCEKDGTLILSKN